MSIDSALLLQNWLSPSFPVGAFAYSHGLEFAIHAGYVHEGDTCREWIADLLLHGSWRNDAIIAGCAWQAMHDHDDGTLMHILELARALAPSRERHMESVQQGNAFMKAVRQSWPHERLLTFVACDTQDVVYPAAIGICAAAHGITRPSMTSAFGLSFAQTLVSAALRLSIIGHTDGQKIIAALLPIISSAADDVACASLDDLGGATFLSDLSSLQHETQFTRFFRS